jgi:steroid delta-isomerase-like uncharacterized protein
VSGDPTAGADPVAVVHRYLDGLNAGDPDAVAACVTDDFVNEHTSALGTSLQGRDAYRQRLPQFLARFEALRYDVEDLLRDGDRVATRYRMTFRWLDDEGAGHPVVIRGTFWFRLRDGLIAHRIDYWDGADFQRQVSGGGGAGSPR